MNILPIIDHACHEAQSGRLPMTALDGTRTPIPPEFCAALALIGYRTGGNQEMSFDEALIAGADAYRDEAVGHETVMATVQEVIAAIQDYGDAMGDAAQCN